MADIKFNIKCESCENEYSVLIDETLGDPTYCTICGEEIDYPVDGYIVDTEEESPYNYELDEED